MCICLTSIFPLMVVLIPCRPFCSHSSVETVITCCNPGFIAISIISLYEDYWFYPTSMMPPQLTSQIVLKTTPSKISSRTHMDIYTLYN